MEEPDNSTQQSSNVTNSVIMCSLFNVKDYNTIINRNNIKISKFMKLNICNNQAIILQNVNTSEFKILSSDSESMQLTTVTNASDPSSPISNLSSPTSPSAVNLIPDVKFCSFCNTGFNNQIEQRQHYKLDWHRYNIKLNIKLKPAVTELEFSQLMSKNDYDIDDISSLSGSESDSSDSDTDNPLPKFSLQPQKPTSDNINVMPSTSNKTRVIFENDKGNIIVLYKCLFSPSNKIDEEPIIETESQYIHTFNKLPITLPNTKSLVIMLGGGHFAAAIFKGSEPILHKTFHSYTVRAKQGGTQSMKDNKRATGAKSAGASLRRYNEQSLTQHVQDLLSSWSNEIAECKYVFYRAVGPGNQLILFGGRQPIIDKNDVRLCKIPFPTRRATYSEIKRVYSLLMSLYIYDSEKIFTNIFQINFTSNYNKKTGDNIITYSPSKKKKEKDKCGDNSIKTNRASKQRQSPSRDNDDEEMLEIFNRLKNQCPSSSGEENEAKDKNNSYCNVTDDVSVSFSESLKEFDNSPVPKKGNRRQPKNVSSKESLENTLVHSTNNLMIDNEPNDDDNINNENQYNKKKKKKKKNDKSEGDRDPLVDKLAKNVYLSCFDGNLNLLQNALEEFKCIKNWSDHNKDRSNEENDENHYHENISEDITFVFNQLTQEGLTLLQNAAKNSHQEIVRFLLENGADPCLKDKKSMTAYDFAPDKDTRNVFRRFMGEFPDKYNYSKSHIPSPLTDSIEKDMAEKKRALKKAKRQKDKERKIADEPRRKEEAEKKRFLELSDREKRALAAERRILASVGKAGENIALVRCFQCAINITGKVPFEYDNKLFCSMDCLKGHRIMAKKNQL